MELSIALNAVTRLANTIRPRDRAEARNLRLFAELTGAHIAGPRSLGTLKPPEFIHPFEEYYTLPGYLDSIVLPYLAQAVDVRARELAEQDQGNHGAHFLAFVYVFFLLVHPFVDGNGRTARALLDYYHKRLKFSCSRPWRIERPKFSARPEHRSAFVAFFRATSLPRRNTPDPYPFVAELRDPLRKMADRLVEWAAAFESNDKSKERPYHRKMTRLISPDSLIA